MLLIGAGLTVFNTADAQTTETNTGNTNNTGSVRDFEVGNDEARTGAQWTFGPKVGLNSSRFTNLSSEKTTGPSAGVFFVYSTSEHFGFTGDLLYSYKGNEWVTVNEDVTAERSTELRYIEMPMQGMVFFRPGAKFRPKIGLGPYVQVLVDGEEHLMVRTITDENVEVVNETETDVAHYRNVDLGLVASTGFNWEVMDRTWINADVRYGHGFRNVYDDVSIMGVKNRNWAVQLGIGFPISRR